MNRRLLSIGAAVAVVGAAFYVLVLRGRGAAEADRPAERTAASRPERDLREPRAPRAVPPPRPTSRDDGGDRPGPSHYLREDGTMVRDHRGEGAPRYLRPSLPHRDASPVTANVTAAVMKEVRPIVLKCLRGLPDSAFGERALVMTRAVVSIDDAGMLSIDELGPDATDVDEAAIAPALDCIRSQATNLKTRVDHGPVASATLAFPIRPLDYRRFREGKPAAP
jgi:hypothetical protein